MHTGGARIFLNKTKAWVLTHRPVRMRHTPCYPFDVVARNRNGAGPFEGRLATGGRSDAESSEEGVRRGPDVCVGASARRATRREAGLQRSPGSMSQGSRSLILASGVAWKRDRPRQRASIHGQRPPATTSLEEGRQESDGSARRGTLAAPSRRGIGSLAQAEKSFSWHQEDEGGCAIPMKVAASRSSATVCCEVHIRRS